MEKLKLEESEHIYGTFFKKVDSAIMIIELLYDINGNLDDYIYIKVNDLFEKLSGLKNCDLIGNRSKSIIPSFDYSWLKDYDEVNKTDKSDYFIKYVENIKVWYEVFCLPYGNNILGVRFKDVTKEVEGVQSIHKNKERYKTYMSASFDGVFRLNPDFSQLTMPIEIETSEGIFSNKVDILRGYIHPDDRNYVNDEISIALHNKSILDCKYRVLKDNYLIWLHSRVVPILNEEGEIVEWLGAIVNITDSKIMEEELRESERKAQELIRELRKKDEQKNRFISTLSHELRNPLAAISMSLSLMDHITPGSEQDINTRDVIKRQTYQLTRLVNDLLEVTRMNRRKIKLTKENIDIVGTVKNTLEEFKAQFNEKAVALEGEYDFDQKNIYADEVRIKQVIGNLLTNSLKFTETGGKVKVRVSLDRVKNEILISISDTGIGIDPDLVPDLFDAFVQADDSLDRSCGGLGLGLSIVKGIVDLHGGSIEAKSEGLGKGSEFIIRLPM